MKMLSHILLNLWHDKVLQNCENCRDDIMKTPMNDATANEKYIEFRKYSNENDDAP